MNLNLLTDEELKEHLEYALDQMDHYYTLYHFYLKQIPTYRNEIADREERRSCVE